MGEKNIILPELRPGRMQGKAYFAALRQLRDEIKYALRHDFEQTKHQNREVVISDTIFWALKYRVTPAALYSILEDERLLPYGTYKSLRDRGFRPINALKEIYSERRDELEIVDGNA